MSKSCKVCEAKGLTISLLSDQVAFLRTLVRVPSPPAKAEVTEAEIEADNILSGSESSTPARDIFAEVGEQLSEEVLAERAAILSGEY